MKKTLGKCIALSMSLGLLGLTAACGSKSAPPKPQETQEKMEQALVVDDASLRESLSTFKFPGKIDRTKLPQPFGNAVIINFAQVLPGIYRGSRPGSNRETFKYLQTYGINYVVNLEVFFKDNLQTCSEFGMSCDERPINSVASVIFNQGRMPLAELQQAFYSVLEIRKAGYITYIHCFFGSDRTSALSTALKVREYGCNGDAAERERLKKDIEFDYANYGANGTSIFYTAAKAEALSWVDNPPEWICTNSY